MNTGVNSVYPYWPKHTTAFAKLYWVPLTGTECTTLHYGFADGTESVLKEAERLLKIGLKGLYPDEKLLWRVPNR